jgi:hypothetical protein
MPLKDAGDTGKDSFLTAHKLGLLMDNRDLEERKGSI